MTDRPKRAGGEAMPIDPRVAAAEFAAELEDARRRCLVLRQALLNAETKNRQLEEEVAALRKLLDAVGQDASPEPSQPRPNGRAEAKPEVVN